jgi:DNA helicase-2/ATP-dependent DNA helicase PcrA
VFPSQRSIEESGLPGLEEERRLAYVGLTRARRRALVSFAANRRIHGQWQASARSRFVDELPKDQIEVETEYGLGPGAGWAATPAANAAWGTGWSEGTQGGYRKSLPRPPLVIDGTRPPPRGQEVRKVGGFSIGDRVFHQKFGYGIVRVVEDNKLEINFEHAGDKKVMDAFVERA